VLHDDDVAVDEVDDGAAALDRLVLAAGARQRRRELLGAVHHPVGREYVLAGRTLEAGVGVEVDAGQRLSAARGAARVVDAPAAAQHQRPELQHVEDVQDVDVIRVAQLAQVRDLGGEQALVRERGVAVQNLDRHAAGGLAPDLLLAAQHAGELALTELDGHP
jgi:hypothetical protein